MLVKKTADRLIIEMTDKLKDWSGDSVKPEKHALNAQFRFTKLRMLFKEAVNALVALGYKTAGKPIKMVSKVEKDSDSSEGLIRLALKSV